jgi:hypothetical protein
MRKGNVMMQDITNTQPHTFAFRGASLIRERGLRAGTAC